MHPEPLVRRVRVPSRVRVPRLVQVPRQLRAVRQVPAPRDFPVLQGLFLIITVMVVLANLLADWLYTVLDPRVRA